MPLFNKTIVECPVHLDHALVDRAQARVATMSLADLYDWAANVAMDLAALIDRRRQGEDVTSDLILADAMSHACVAEITRRST